MSQLFYKLRAAIISIATIDSEGNHGIGTGFHVGDGIVITARHVVQGMESIQLESREARGGNVIEVVGARNTLADVALLRTDLDFSYYRKKVTIHGMSYRKVDYLELGVEFDDTVNENLVLHDVMVMGFPPIPTAFPTLVAVRAQVNALVDQYPVGGRHSPPQYILSGIPRGGFSGAPMIGDAGDDSFVLGVVTSSLVTDYRIPETGFIAAVTIESVLELLHENQLYPEDNALAVKAFAMELTEEEEAAYLNIDNEDI